MTWRIGLALAGVLAGGGQPAAAVGAAGRWGQAIEVPGLGALNKGEQAQVLSVSCSPRPSCAAGGFYRDGDGHQQGFVVSERNGVWRQATEVPGLSALATGGGAHVGSVSCASAGNCAAGGSYGSVQGETFDKGFVASEKNDVWGRAIEVPGLGTLTTGRFARVASVSCASPGTCAAGGSYADRSGHYNRLQGFVT